MEDQYDSKKNYTGTVFNDFAYTSWGEKSNAATYDNIGDFFQGGNIFDESASVAGGTKNSKFYVHFLLIDLCGEFQAAHFRPCGIYTVHIDAAVVGRGALSFSVI